MGRQSLEEEGRAQKNSKLGRSMRELEKKVLVSG
jgi:hypothetical protein